MKLEIIGFNIESCIAAQEAGADRIELCDNPSDGGTTPSYGMIQSARKNLSIQLHSMIRPRGGDFYFTDHEFEIMKSDIGVCKRLGCDGVVIGILKKNGDIDKEKCGELVNLAYPLGVTFHRAFDRARDPFIALENIIDIGCERILTSGQQPKAIDGVQLINELVSRANDRIIIMPGSGIDSNNIISMAEKTGAEEFHSSARFYAESNMEYTNGLMDESLKNIGVNKNEVMKMAELLKGYRK